MPACLFCYKDAGERDYHPICCKRFFGTEKLPLLTLDKALLLQLGEQTINRHIAITGVQPKLSASLQKTDNGNRITITNLWGEYILKPQHEGYPFMPETEDLTMHLAKIFKINTCSHTLLKTTDGSLAYIAKRFDRHKKVKIHVEDLCQVSGFLTENKYKGSHEKVGKLIAQYCTNTGLDTLNYFELVLFSYLTGNNDMHLKNFSVMHKVDTVCLSPAYDLLNVNLVNPADDDELALTLNGKKKKLKLADFVALASSLNIPEKSFQNSCKKFTAKNDAVKQLIFASFLPEEAKEKYWQIWLKKQKIFS